MIKRTNMLLRRNNRWHTRHHKNYGKNIINFFYKNEKEKYIELPSSQMKIYKLYNNTNWDFRTDEFPLTKSELELKALLNDPTNYYKNFSFTLTKNQIKDIFENKNYKLTLNTLKNFIDTKDYLYLLNHSDIDLSRGIYTKIDEQNKYNNILIDLKNQLIPDWAIKDISIGQLFQISKLYTKLSDAEFGEKIFKS